MKNLCLILFLLYCVIFSCNYSEAGWNESGKYTNGNLKVDISSVNGEETVSPLKTQDIDVSERASLNTVFGEKIIGTRIPSVASQFQYGIASDRADTDLTLSGSATTSNSLLVVSTGTNAAGAARIETKDYLRYIPGHEAYMVFTGVFTQGVADSFQRGGLFDDENGFFIGYEGETFCVTRRRNSVDVNHEINLANVFSSEYSTFDPTKGNVYRISFGYLGFATINFEVLTPGGYWVSLHKIEYPNTATVTHITQTNLPARAQVANTGNTTDISIKSGSYEFGTIDGGGSDPAARAFSSFLSQQSITAGNNLIVIFRNKSTFKSIDNRISGKLILISASTDLSKISSWRIIRDMTLTNSPTWTDINTDDSTFEYSTDATVTFGTGDILIPWTMGKTSTFFENVGEFDILIRPGETAAVVIQTEAGTTGTVDVAFRWIELF